MTIKILTLGFEIGADSVHKPVRVHGTAENVTIIQDDGDTQSVINMTRTQFDQLLDAVEHTEKLADQLANNP